MLKLILERRMKVVVEPNGHLYLKPAKKAWEPPSASQVAILLLRAPYKDQVVKLDLKDLELDALPIPAALAALFPALETVEIGQPGTGYAVGHGRPNPMLQPTPFNLGGVMFLSLAANLRFLAVTHCDLQEVPPQIGQLHHLLHLHLSNNRLAELPTGMTRMQRLQSLELSGNPLPHGLARDCYVKPDTQALLAEVDACFGVACKSAVITWLCANHRGGYFPPLGHDIVQLIARWVWSSRHEPVWRDVEFRVSVEPTLIELTPEDVRIPDAREIELEGECVDHGGGGDDEKKCVVQ